MVADAALGTAAPFLRVIDRFNDVLVGAYLLPSGLTLLLLWEGAGGGGGAGGGLRLESVRAFLAEVHELLIKVPLLFPLLSSPCAN